MMYLIAIMSLLSMLTFLGIVGWAWSRSRQRANRESALLPFALPDEGQGEQAAGAHRP